MLQSMYHLMQQLSKSGTESTLKWVENNSSTHLSGDKEVGKESTLKWMENNFSPVIKNNFYY